MMIAYGYAYGHAYSNAYSTSCTPLYVSSRLDAPAQSNVPLTSSSTTSMTVSMGPISCAVESRSLPRQRGTP